LDKTPLSELIVPLPLTIPPFHIAEALRFIFNLLSNFILLLKLQFNESQVLMRLKFHKRSAVKFKVELSHMRSHVGLCCQSNYPTSEANWDCAAESAFKTFL
jgi:hypothetical protein